MMENDKILVLRVPVPVPEIRSFSRWQVFLALFNPKAQFTTCERLQHRLVAETEMMAHSMVNSVIGKPRYDA